MDEEKPSTRRGRPRGTGIDDSSTLAVVADVLLASPGMRPTTAMKRAVRGVEATRLRRLQEKWRDHGTRLLAEARERAKQRDDVAARAAAAHALAVAKQGLSVALRNPIGMADHKATRTALDILGRPAMKAMQLEHAAIAGLFPQHLGDLVGNKKLMDLMDPPALRALRQTMEIPVLREMRVMQETLDCLNPLWRRRR